MQLFSLFCITVLFSDKSLSEFTTGMCTGKDKFSGPGRGEALSSGERLCTSREMSLWFWFSERSK